MATSSIMKDIVIRKKILGRQLLAALESASEKKAKEVLLSKKYREINGEQIKELFGKK